MSPCALIPKAAVKVTPGKATSMDLKFRLRLDRAKAVPHGTVKPITNSVAAIISAAILRFFISSPLFPRETLERLTVSRTWPLFTSRHFPQDSATRAKTGQFAED